MKKLLFLLLVVVLGVAVYRRISGTQGPASFRRTHQHGTPGHWPPVVPKRVPETVSTTSAA